MKKALLVSVLLIAGAMTVFAGGQREAATGESADGVTTIRVWKFGGPQHERDYMIEKIAVFEAANPDVKVEWIYQNYDERRTRVITASTAGNLPHVILSDGQSIPEYVELGIVQSFEELAPERVSIWRDRFVPEGWNTGVYNGQTYGVSTYVDAASMIAYNTDMFVAAGIVDSEGNARPPRDWAEVLSIARDFKSRGMAGIVLPGSTASNDLLIFQGIAYRNGGRWVDDSGNVAVDGPGFVDTLQFYRELTQYAQSGYSDTNFRQAMELFFQGQAPMAMTMSYAPILRQSLGAPADFPYSIAPFPKNRTDTGRFSSASFIMTPTVAHVVPAALPASHRDAVVRYVDFWMTEEAQAGWSGSVIEGRVPIMISNLESSDFARVYPDLANSFQSGTLFDGALPMPGFAGLAEAEQIMIEAFQSVLLGLEPPRDAMRRVRPEIQAVLDRSQR